MIEPEKPASGIFRQYVPVLLLGAVLSVFLLWRLGTDRYTPSWDQSYHLEIAYRYYRAAQGGLGKLADAIAREKTMYPPGYHLAVAAAYGIVGVRPEAGVLANVPFVLVFSAAVYCLTKRLTGNRFLSYGTVAACLVIPSVSNLIQDSLTDFTAISLFLAGICLIGKTDGYRKTGWSVVFAVTVLAMLLTRWGLIVPVMPFAAYAVIGITGAAGRRAVVHNLAIMGAIAAISLLWVIPHYPYISDTMQFFSRRDNYPLVMWRTPVGMTAANLTYYLRTSLGNIGIGSIPLGLFVLSVIIGGRRRPFAYWCMLVSVVTVFAVQTAYADKADKYVAPAHVLMTIMTVYWIAGRKDLIRRILSAVLAIVLGTNAVWGAVYPNRPGPGPAIGKYRILPGVSNALSVPFWPVRQILADNFATSRHSGILP
jgi:hypothetical protein